MSDGGAAANLWAREARPRKRSRVGEAGGHQPLSLSIASARSARARTSKRWVPASFSFDSERAKRASPNQQTVGSKRMQQPECTSRYTPNRNRPLPAGCEWKSEKSEWWVWSFDFFDTFICFRGVLNLKRYMGKKVHNNFFMGSKIW